MREVILHGDKAAGRVALVDDEDYEMVSGYRWYVDEYQRGSGLKVGPYAVSVVNRAGPGEPRKQSTIRMHKLITGWRETDHADHNGLNNQRSNLRPAEGRNQRNSRKGPGTSSAYKGVSWYAPTNRWVAQISRGYKKIYLGYFADEKAAALAYDAAARELFGEFACTNFEP
jgi:hypothetical protein